MAPLDLTINFPPQNQLVVIESPYAGDVDLNVDYARAAMADSLARGEAPIASHLIYTQPGILNDDIYEERVRGIEAGILWSEKADLIAVYTDLGISPGMTASIAKHRLAGRPVEMRTLFPPAGKT